MASRHRASWWPRFQPSARTCVLVPPGGVAEKEWHRISWGVFLEPVAHA